MPKSTRSNPASSVRRFSFINQQSIIYTLLLIATFFVGYLLATVQHLKSTPSGSVQGVQEQAGGQPDPNKVYDVTEGHLPVKGDKNAKVTIVEFSDFECPFCAAFHKDTLPQILKDYVDTGKVKLYYRHFPLDFHPQAKPLALASECANEQGKFWEFHDKTFTENSAGALETATVDTYKQWAVDLGLDSEQFNSCLDSSKYESNVTGDASDGQKNDVTGTPTFFINGKQLVGAQPYSAFKTAIDAALAK